MAASSGDAWIDSWTPPSEMELGEWCENVVDDDGRESGVVGPLSGTLIGIILSSEDGHRQLFFRMGNGDIWVGHWSADRWENDDAAEACFCLAYRKDGVLMGIGGWRPVPYEEDLSEEEVAEIRREHPDADVQDPARIYLDVEPRIYLGDVR